MPEEMNGAQELKEIRDRWHFAVTIIVTLSRQVPLKQVLCIMRFESRRSQVRLGDIRALLAPLPLSLTVRCDIANSSE